MFSPFTFAQISDTHVRAAGAEWDARVDVIFAAVQALSPAPEFLLHTGDLLDDPTEADAAAFRARLGQGKLPMHVVPGNHDVWNAPTGVQDAPWWTRATTSEDEQRFRGWFGATAYSFMSHGCAFVTFNSQLLNAALPEARAQWDWLAAELARLRAQNPKHLILFTHMPLFVRSPSEELDWSDWRSAYLVISPPGRDYVMDLIKRYRVSAYLSGHWHYPVEHTIAWTETHTTRFITCDASGPASQMAQEQFSLPARATRAAYCLHRVTGDEIVTEFVTI